MIPTITLWEGRVIEGQESAFNHPEYAVVVCGHILTATPEYLEQRAYRDGLEAKAKSHVCANKWHTWAADHKRVCPACLGTTWTENVHIGGRGNAWIYRCCYCDWWDYI